MMNTDPFRSYNGILSINSDDPSRATVTITSPSVLVKKPASQYEK